VDRAAPAARARGADPGALTGPPASAGAWEKSRGLRERSQSGASDRVARGIARSRDDADAALHEGGAFLVE